MVKIKKSRGVKGIKKVVNQNKGKTKAETTDKALINVGEVFDTKQLKDSQLTDNGSNNYTNGSENTSPNLSVQTINETDQINEKALIKNEKETDQKSKKKQKVEKEEKEEKETKEEEEEKEEKETKEEEKEKEEKETKKKEEEKETKKKEEEKEEKKTKEEEKEKETKEAEKEKETKKKEEEKEEKKTKEEEEKKETEKEENALNKYAQKKYQDMEKDVIKRKNRTKKIDMNTADGKKQIRRRTVAVSNSGLKENEGPVNNLPVDKKIEELENSFCKKNKQKLNKKPKSKLNANDYNKKKKKSRISNYSNDNCADYSVYYGEVHNDNNKIGMYNNISPDKLMKLSEQCIENENKKQTNKNYLDPNYKGQIVVDGTNKVDDLLLVSRIAYNDNLKQIDKMQMLQKKNKHMISLSNEDAKQKMETKFDDYALAADLQYAYSEEKMSPNIELITFDEVQSSNQYEEMDFEEKKLRNEINNVVINDEKEEKQDISLQIDDCVDTSNTEAVIIINKSDIYHFEKIVNESKNNEDNIFIKQIKRIILIGCPHLVSYNIEIEKLGHISNIENDIIEIFCIPLKYIFSVGTVVCLSNRIIIGCIANINYFGNKITCFLKVICKEFLNLMQIGIPVFVDLDHALYLNMDTKVCREIFDAIENTKVSFIYISYTNLENVGKMQLQSLMNEKEDYKKKCITSDEQQFQKKTQIKTKTKNDESKTHTYNECGKLNAKKKKKKKNIMNQKTVEIFSQSRSNKNEMIPTVQMVNTDCSIIPFVPNDETSYREDVLPTPYINNASNLLPISNNRNMMTDVSNKNTTNTGSIVPYLNFANTMGTVTHHDPTDNMVFVPNKDDTNKMDFGLSNINNDIVTNVPNYDFRNMMNVKQSNIINNIHMNASLGKTNATISSVSSSSPVPLYANKTSYVGANTNLTESKCTDLSYNDIQNMKNIQHNPNNHTSVNEVSYHNNNIPTTLASNNNYQVTTPYNEASNISGNNEYKPHRANDTTFCNSDTLVPNKCVHSPDNYRQLNPVNIGPNQKNISVSTVASVNSVSPFASGTPNYRTAGSAQRNFFRIPPTQPFSSQLLPSQQFPPQSLSTQSMSTQSFPLQSMSTQSFPLQSMSTQSFPLQSFSPQSFCPQSFSPQSFCSQSFSPQSFCSQSFSPQSFPAQPTRRYPNSNNEQKTSQ